MTQKESDKFCELFSQCLIGAGIEYAATKDGEAYVAYNEDGILFTATYYKHKGKYVFGRTDLLKAKYKKYGLSHDDMPNPKMVFETLAFTYKLRKIAVKARKNVSDIYNEIMIDSDIIFQMRGNFETYMVMNSGFSGYAIGYDEKTGQYGFKRYELVETLYKICEISPDKKPDYAHLYKRTKDYYLAQEVVENIRHLYD